MFTSILTNFSSLFNYCSFELRHANTSSQSPATRVKNLGLNTVYPLKTSENLRFFDVFRGVHKFNIGRIWVKCFTVRKTESKIFHATLQPFKKCFGCFISTPFITLVNFWFSDVFRGKENKLFHLETKHFNFNRNQGWLGYSDTTTSAFTNTKPKNIPYGAFLSRKKLLNFASSEGDFVQQKFCLTKSIDFSE